MAKTSPPNQADLELSLFGPGIGECLVAHLGFGNWMVVDSCLNEAGDRPIALDYLEELGVDVNRQVKLVVVTHWHDDHIRGISQVVRAAGDSHFACSAALQTKEFLQLVANDEIKLVEHSSGVDEFSEVLSILELRSGKRRRSGPDYWAHEGMRLYYDQTQGPVEVHALSPSAQTVTDSLGGFAKLLPSEGESIRRFPCVTPNDRSVALLVTSAKMHFLLGADLETGNDVRRGWRAVIESRVRPNAISSGYKVAHHGSGNADLEEIWTLLVVKNSRALLTPYARGRQPLPSEADVRRIKSNTQHVYCTVWPPTQPPPRRNVDRTMNEVTRSRRAVSKRPGHVRLRVPFDGDLDAMSVERFDGSRRL